MNLENKKRGVKFKLLAAGIAVIAVAEIAPRWLGMVDFPIYDANNDIGYIPTPSQSGSFLNKNDWFINSISMASEQEFTPSVDQQDILLIGDSIVWGGNSFTWDDRLSQQMNVLNTDNIWSVSAGSWAIVNELHYLKDHPEVVRGVDRIIWVVNEGDFGRASSWSNPLTHPRHHPVSAFYYLVSKYVIKPTAPAPSEDLIVPNEDAMASLGAFVGSCNCSIDFWVWPTKQEIQDGTAETYTSDQMVAKLGEVVPAEWIHRVDQVAGWDTSMYQDSIHPTPSATGVVAKALMEVVE